jgi:hypothetical protein
VSRSSLTAALGLFALAMAFERMFLVQKQASPRSAMLTVIAAVLIYPSPLWLSCLALPATPRIGLRQYKPYKAALAAARRIGAVNEAFGHAASLAGRRAKIKEEYTRDITGSRKRPAPKHARGAGVPSSAVLALLEAIEREHAEVHTMMICGTAKSYAGLPRAPYTGESPAFLFSLSKSICSLAFGIAVEGGGFARLTKSSRFSPSGPTSRWTKKMADMTVATV